MKKITSSFIGLALAILGTTNMQAQAEFDFSKATNYCIIYLDNETAAGIQNEIMIDLTTPNIDVWPEGQSYDFKEARGANSNGVVGEFIHLITLPWEQEWAGGGFNTGVRDLSKIDESFYFHMALKSEDTQSFQLIITGSKDKEANLVFGDAPMDNIQPFDNFTRDGEWHAIDISVKELMEYGWEAGQIDYSPFSYLLGDTPGVELCMDAIFYYQLKEDSGVSAVESNQPQLLIGEKTISLLGATVGGIELYDISGKLVKSTQETVIGTENLNKGVYVVKAGTVVKKVFVK